MPFTFTMPKLSPTMEQGTIVKWHKKEGEYVESGDVLLEVATDKATVEHQALDEGWLRKILIQEGNEATVNQPIAVFSAEEKEDLKSYHIPEKPSGEVHEDEHPISKPQEKQETSETLIKKTQTLISQPQFIPELPLVDYEFEYPTHSEKRILASPLAKRLAKEKGLDLSTIKGTGPNQRIMSRDLSRAQPSGIVSFGHREKPGHVPGSFEEISLSPIRKVIGQRLQESKSFIPHFYVSQTVNAENLVALREQLKVQDIKVSINDLIVKACAIGLRVHPSINTGYHSVNQSIIQFKTVDIAIAVSLESGLITPIVRHADHKNLGEISLEIKTLAQRAREGKLQPHEYKGGSFTISNLGMYGITNFQAIINPPQSAILAVGGIQDVPVVKEQSVVSGKTLNLTLSVDHRVIDGAQAAVFLATLKKYIENPAFLIIG